MTDTKRRGGAQVQTQLFLSVLHSTPCDIRLDCAFEPSIGHWCQRDLRVRQIAPGHETDGALGGGATQGACSLNEEPSYELSDAV
jgi:hypothetical protein